MPKLFFFTVLAMVCFMFAHVFGRPCLFLQLNNVLGALKWHENSETEKKKLLMSSAKCIFLKHKKHGRHVIFFRYQQVPYLLLLAIGLCEVRPPKHSWHAISRSFLNIAKTDKHGCHFSGNGKRSSTSYDNVHSYKIHMYIITSMAGAPRIHAHTHKAVMKIKEKVGTLMKLKNIMKKKRKHLWHWITTWRTMLDQT